MEAISINLLKLNMDVFSYPLTRLITLHAHKNNFPDELKLADVSSLSRKSVRTNSTSYRSISLLPTISIGSKSLIGREL